ncbi:OsmC family protein [Dictyobacter arantiisoli]|uniref:Peroxiredoxin n=1 Tax=Dictyobacter arantiisoli TaxID=2014874 RepID=A0A5A5TE67_9CHLR|nr:OsmC family protein [Dictyobacter arantiisoli]GCF09436.1 peroxiredoxin [Dictyobacter arantiisoli]
MEKELNIQAKLLTGLSFAVETGSGHTLQLDNEMAPEDTGSGPCPMELLLSALAGCAGIEIITILRKMKSSITDYEIRAYGTKTAKPPHIFQSINVEHFFKGQDIKPAAVQRAIKLVEESYCSVSAMLDKSIQIQHTFHIIDNNGQRLVAAGATIGDPIH